MLRQFFASAAILTAAVLILMGAAMLSGCNRMEGAGFGNSGAYQRVVKCDKPRPGLTRCYSVAR